MKATIAAVLAAAAAATKCDPKMCGDWSCSTWCACYDETVDYSAFGCEDDGTASCSCPKKPTYQPVISATPPSHWGGCPNGNDALIHHTCPANGGKKCNDRRGFFNNIKVTGREECEECPAIAGCQLTRPLYGVTDKCACHSCYGIYTKCPAGNGACSYQNQLTGESNQRFISRYGTEDQTQCIECPHSDDPEVDACSFWRTAYGKRGVEACECVGCYKGFGMNLEGKCTKYMTNPSGDGVSWVALPQFASSKYATTAAQLSAGSDGHSS